MFFTSYNWFSLRLLQLETEEQTIQTEHLTKSCQPEIKILAMNNLAQVHQLKGLYCVVLQNKKDPSEGLTHAHTYSILQKIN